MQNRLPTQRPMLAFEPVPRKYRVDGWTADRQRAFIAALAATGSVKAAAHRINMSPEGAYYLRRAPGAEEFAAAWQAAVDHGVQTLTDIAIERARDGVAVPIYWKGEQVGEKRWYNDRLLMFVLRHHLPQKYGALAALPPGTKHPDTIAREEAAAQAAAEEDAEAAAREDERLNRELLHRYQMKVIEERRHRLAGHIVAADYVLRQLTHIELIIDVAGETSALIDRATGIGPTGAPTSAEPYASDVSTLLADLRELAWAKAGDPPRPKVWRPKKYWPGSMNASGGERYAIQQAAAERIAEAQAEWEAAATEEGWKAWCGGR